MEARPPPPLRRTTPSRTVVVLSLAFAIVTAFAFVFFRTWYLWHDTSIHLFLYGPSAPSEAIYWDDDAAARTHGGLRASGQASVPGRAGHPDTRSTTSDDRPDGGLGSSNGVDVPKRAERAFLYGSGVPGGQGNAAHASWWVTYFQLTVWTHLLCAAVLLLFTVGQNTLLQTPLLRDWAPEIVLLMLVLVSTVLVGRAAHTEWSATDAAFASSDVFTHALLPLGFIAWVAWYRPLERGSQRLAAARVHRHWRARSLVLLFGILVLWLVVNVRLQHAREGKWVYGDLAGDPSHAVGWMQIAAVGIVVCLLWLFYQHVLPRLHPYLFGAGARALASE